MGLTRPRAHQLQDIDYKQTARAVTVANVSLSGGAPAVVDGVSLALRDRVLVTAQSTGSENGIYYVTTVGAGSNGTWARSLDADATGEIKAGTIIMITEGTTYADTQWKLTTDDPITVGSTTMTFVRAGNAAYGTFAVAGQNSIVADQIGDTLTVVAGTNIALTTNDGTDTLTITPSLTPAVTTLDATGNITGGNLITAGSITLNQLSLNSDLTTVSPLQLTAGSLQDGVGALRIDAVEPDIYLNDTNASGHSTVTFATGNVAAAAIGKNNNEDFYITVNTGSGWLDTTFIADHLTGNISLGYNLAVTGNITAGNAVATGNITGGNLITGAQVIATGNITGGNLITAGDVEIQARSELKLFDSDSSHYVSLLVPSTVSANVALVLPGDDGSSDQVLSTNGSGTLSWVDQSGGGGSGASSFPNSTVTPLPSSEGNFDLSFNYAQTTQETPFESGGTDAFGVSLGEVYSMMDPAGDIPDATDLGVLT